MAPSATAMVVDNGSTDGTVERVQEWARSRPGVRVIANPQNEGFAAAANLGVRESGGAEFILLLNPDARLLTGLDPLIAATQQYGLAAGKLVDEYGCAQEGFTVRRLPTAGSLILELFGVNRLWPRNPVNRRYRELDRDLDRAAPAEQPAGAFLMTRRDVWEKLGGLDEQFYPVWFEDVDFCRRAFATGYRIQYEPAAAASHEGGHSVSRIPPGQRTQYWCVSLLRYAGKHFRPWAFRGISAAVVLSSVPRMVAGMIWERSLSPFVAYFKIMRFAGACLLFPGHIRGGYVKKGTTGIS